jgi:hypothetical protein
MRHLPIEDKISESVLYENAIKRIRAKLGLQQSLKDFSSDLRPLSPNQSIKLEDSPSKNTNKISKSNSKPFPKKTP